MAIKNKYGYDDNMKEQAYEDSPGYYGDEACSNEDYERPVANTSSFQPGLFSENVGMSGNHGFTGHPMPMMDEMGPMDGQNVEQSPLRGLLTITVPTGNLNQEASKARVKEFEEEHQEMIGRMNDANIEVLVLETKREAPDVNFVNFY